MRSDDWLEVVKLALLVVGLAAVVKGVFVVLDLFARFTLGVGL